MEPVTGRHSVILNLIPKLVPAAWQANWLRPLYPDSVNLVRPPKTTIPKTLTALPMSQYPTLLEEALGHELLAASAIPGADRAATCSAMLATGLAMVASE